MTIFQRRLVVLGAVLLGWFVIWGTLGYFAGLRGVGYGWPAFWSVGALCTIPWGMMGLVVLYIRYVEPWISRGRP